jgi:hypothetical protein
MRKVAFAVPVVSAVVSSLAATAMHSTCTGSVARCAA